MWRRYDAVDNLSDAVTQFFVLLNSYTSCSICVQVMREQGAELEFKVWGLGDKVWRLGDVKEEQPPTCSVELDPPQKEELEESSSQK